MEYPNLFTSMNIGSVEIKNRLVMTAMCVGLAEHDGAVSEALAAYYEERAAGGAGLIITECSRINETDAVSHSSMLSMSHDRYIKPLSKAVERVHAHGAKMFVQLFHPGRQNVVIFPALWQFNERMARIIPHYWDLYFKATSKFDASAMDDPKTVKRMKRYMKPLLAPSDVPCGLGENPIRNQSTVPLTLSQIKTLINQFVSAAKRVKKAGADGVELHAAHGYLIQQFLSPYTNRREDEYGGTLTNRMRFLKEIIDGIRRECGADFPISVRLSVEEFYDMIGYPDQGITLDEGVEMAKRLEGFGIDVLNVSSGNYDTAQTSCEPISFTPGWRKYLAKEVKKQVKIPVIAANLIRTPEQAEAQLAEGTQDFIAMGRSYLADPKWPKKAMEGRSEDINRCICCLRCMESFQENIMNGKPVECAVNPRACRESKIPSAAPKDGRQRQVVVVGAGPAGLTAAVELAARDFKVTVLERGDAPGGQLILAAAPPLKEKIDWLIQYLTRQALRLGVDIQYNTQATRQLIDSYQPYAVFLATGGEAVAPRIPGSESEAVTTVTPILTGEREYTGKEVAVIGSGMTGLETSELLMEQGNTVTIIEMADEIAPGAYPVNASDVIQRLEKGGVRFLPGRKLERIGEGMLYLRRTDEVQEEIQADYTVLAIGVRSSNGLEKECAGHFERLYPIGDAVKPGRIGNATGSAFELARALQ
ncbi:NAD(P)/FAD-dependent oxidoreductase [Anaerovorax odorimutans]|uniref:NAD(P)/FAD-dependent oxidoreductase n=1 Tax=Anaerovorax odorimutans TaxID=109327 RepID=A0ABT1RRD6_9FIRM|nr:NAD(P)/FAD-dependent oxidoreductase [Anaerovorax odorimutans]MCQ4637733.1 NAD(P)/FAD-dependent oxidoreductase [Anaerovorax odorimutans]